MMFNNGWLRGPGKLRCSFPKGRLIQLRENLPLHHLDRFPPALHLKRTHCLRDMSGHTMPMGGFCLPISAGRIEPFTAEEYHARQTYIAIDTEYWAGKG